MKKSFYGNNEMNSEINMIYYNTAIQSIKNAIIHSRYRAAFLANRELLALYFGIGEYVSQNTRNKNWGTGAIEIISERLQQELPGLRGFSATNIKNMRLFYEEWKDYIQIRQLSTVEFQFEFNHVSSNSQFFINDSIELNNTTNSIRQMPSAELTQNQIDLFLKVSFSQHREILRSCNLIYERLFYIEQCALHFWSFEKLKYKIGEELPFEYRNILPDAESLKQLL